MEIIEKVWENVQEKESQEVHGKDLNQVAVVPLNKRNYEMNTQDFPKFQMWFG